MEIDFETVDLPEPTLAEGFRFLNWHPSLQGRHAFVKFESFRSEIDSRVFRCLGEYSGCQRLMGEIAGQRSFIPQSTWLINYCPEGESEPGVDCGTIQGLAQGRVLGSIQNVGIVPDFRGLGLGRAIVLQSLIGFRKSGMRRVYLEVTADNSPAVQLYRSLGFRLMRTMYKAAEVEVAQVC